MSKQKQVKVATKYDDDMSLIVSLLRMNPQKFVQLYKKELDDCLSALPKKLWEDQTFIQNLLDKAPEVQVFVKKLKNLSVEVYVKLVDLDFDNFKDVPRSVLNQKFINKLVSKNVKHIHKLPNAWRTYDTLEHFYSTYSNEQTVEIIEDLSTYASSLSENEEKNLVEKFGVLTFVKQGLTQEQVNQALEKNAFNIYTVPDSQMTEQCAIKAITMNPEVALCKKIKFTDRIKQTFLNMIASMDKFKASALLSKAMTPFLKMIQEYDKKVKIVKDWSFFNKSEDGSVPGLAVA